MKNYEVTATSFISLTTILLYFGPELFELCLQCCHQSRFERFDGFCTVWIAIDSYACNIKQDG